MGKKIKELLFFLAITIFPTFLVWMPFFFRFKSFWGIPLPQEGMATIVANYDGPLFLVVAKSLYATSIINSFPLTLPSIYYAAHFPIYPLLIRISSSVFGYPYAMLAMTIFGSFLSVYFFNLFIKRYVSEKNALWLTLFFSLFPARWLIVRSVGSSEPLFIAEIIASIYYFQNKKYLRSGIWGGLAALTKSPGILLFMAYMLSIFVLKLRKSAISPISEVIKLNAIKKYLPLLIIPISLAGLFVVYKYQFNDFFAYFHSGDNIHLFFPPFQIFNFSQPWVGTFWLEEIIFIYLAGIATALKLIKKYKDAVSDKTEESVTMWFFLIFFSKTLFISHRDLLRYSLPLLPFCFSAFSDILIKKEAKIAFFFIIIPIYLFSLSYISQNVMPISNWAPFL